MNERFFYTAQIAEELQKPPNTIIRWSDKLEEYGYTIRRDDQKNRAYTETDLEAMKRFVELRDNRVGLDNAAKQICEEFKGRVPIDVELLENRRETNFDTPEGLISMIQSMYSSQQRTEHELTNTQKQLDDIRELLEAIASQNGLIERIGSTLHELHQSQRLLAESGKSERLEYERETQKRLDDFQKLLTDGGKAEQAEIRTFIRSSQLDLRLLEIDCVNRLRKEAMDDWNRLPMAERVTGFLIFKKEDLHKREAFVERYVQERLPGEMRKALEMRRSDS